ncbi:uncharacterized protein LOC141702169 [Apium graveolens]|uniref:uncharacterized protein LOC141702169 n=1 Tax=Apium graveolens TaxID=4045 RepID=UPI003D7A7BEF
MSLKEALTWIKTLRTRKIMFESYAKLLVDAFQGRKGKSIFDMRVEDCKELFKHFDEVLFVFVHQSANQVAHALAQTAYSMSGPKEWCYAAPDFIRCNIALEGI